MWKGRFPIAAGETLSLGEKPNERSARFAGHPVAVRVDSVDARGPSSIASVVVRAPALGPALVLSGRLRIDAVPLFAARDLPVVDRHVVLHRAAPLRFVGGDGATSVVEPLYGDFADLRARTSCDDIVVQDPGHGTATERRRRGAPMHLAHRRAPLFAAPSGAPVLVLSATRPGPTVYVTATQGSFRRIAYEDGARIDGWMRADDLAPGEGPDCDDCHGSIMDADDLCPLRPAPRDDACPEAALGAFHARRKVAVRDRPSPEGAALGWLEESAEVRVFESRGGYARFEPATGEIHAPPTGFWVDETALDATVAR